MYSSTLFVRVCVCVYTIFIGLIQKKQRYSDILNTNIKDLRVTKYKFFIFMATSRLKSGSARYGTVWNVIVNGFG